MASGENSSQPTPKPSPKGSGFPKFNFYWIYGIVAIGIIAMSLFSNTKEPISVSYSQLIKSITLIPVKSTSV